MRDRKYIPAIALRVFYSGHLNWRLALFFFAPFASFFALRSSFVPPSLLGRRTSPGVVQTRGLKGAECSIWSIFPYGTMVPYGKMLQFRGVRACQSPVSRCQSALGRFVTPRKPDHWSITLADGAPATRSARLGRPWSAQPTAPNRHHGQRAFPFQRFPSLSFEVSFPLPFLPFPSFPFLPHRAIASGPRRHVRMAIA